jgi:hypothetical protein
MHRHFLALLILWFAAGPAAAQFRNIPVDAKRAEMRHVQDMQVELDGKPMKLAPGAQIRNPNNLIILPMALPAGAKVKYTVDAAGEIARVWILSDEEAARPDPTK